MFHVAKLVFCKNHNCEPPLQIKLQKHLGPFQGNISNHSEFSKNSHDASNQRHLHKTHVPYFWNWYSITQKIHYKFTFYILIFKILIVPFWRINKTNTINHFVPSHKCLKMKQSTQINFKCLMMVVNRIYYSSHIQFLVERSSFFPWISWHVSIQKLWLYYVIGSLFCDTIDKVLLGSNQIEEVYHVPGFYGSLSYQFRHNQILNNKGRTSLRHSKIYRLVEWGNN